MKRTNTMPNSLEQDGICSSDTTTNQLTILSPQDRLLTQEVINGFIGMFEEDEHYIKHLERLRTFRNLAADLLEKNPSIHDKIFPLFDTCNRLAGILLLNPKAHEMLPIQPYYINPKK